MNLNGSSLLRLLALVCFIIAAVIAILADGPDVFDVLGAVSIGLGLWVASTLTT